MMEKRSPPANPKNYAIGLLSRREWSASELRERLIQRGFDVTTADETLNFLKENGWQSDERFASSRARTLSYRKGNRAIAQDLKSKDIDASLIETELEQLDDEELRAVNAVRKFEGKEIDLKLKAKIWRFLASRGFSGKSIQAALKHLEQ